MIEIHVAMSLSHNTPCRSLTFLRLLPFHSHVLSDVGGTSSDSAPLQQAECYVRFVVPEVDLIVDRFLPDLSNRHYDVLPDATSRDGTRLFASLPTCAFELGETRKIL